MAKFYGKLGYADQVETAPGVSFEVITERSYPGEVLRNSRRWQSAEKLNDDLEINNTISIIADPYAYNNFHKLRYVVWQGAKWKAASVEVDPDRPRLNITIGGVYNGITGPASPDPDGYPGG